MSFPLQSLINALSPSCRNLLIDVRDPAGLAGQMPVTRGRAIDLAGESEMVFCKSESPELVAALIASRSLFIVARPEIVPILPAGKERVLILTQRPRLLMALLLAPLDAPSAVAQQKELIHPKARIALNAVLGPGVVIGADVEIGPGCVIGPNTVVDHATIGKDTRIGFNCSLGGDGFGYEIDEETGELAKFPHFGRILIGRRVEILTNCGIARGSLRDTVIEDDVKIDNLVHIAHNCHIQRGALIIANTMLGGSATIGEHTWLAPSTSIMNGIDIGRCSMTGLGAVVTKPVGENEVVIGIPAKKLRNRFPEGASILEK